MLLTIVEWVIFLSFFVIVTGFAFAEAKKLSGKSPNTFGKSLAFSILSDFIGLFIGFAVVFLIMVLLMMMVFEKSFQESNITGPLAAAGLVFCAVFPLLSLVICKRLFLAVLKIQTEGSAWLYSFLSSFLVLIFSLGVPSVMAYVFYSVT